MERIASIKIQAKLKNLSEIRKFIELQAREIGISEEDTSRIRMAVDEASANIILHGYGDLEGDLGVNIDHGDGKLTVSLVDSAPAFNPLQRDTQVDLNSPLEERPIGGLGILFILDTTDAQEYRYSEAGENILSLTINERGHQP